MKYSTALTFLFIYTVIVLSGLSAETDLSISGTCWLSEKGILYIYLVDEKSFSKQQVSLRQKIIEVKEVPKEGKIVNYKFYIEPGEYGIRCFLDTNGNGELDGGIFGPAEPWGMSWKKERIVKWPKFQEISFEVKDYFQVPMIVME